MKSGIRYHSHILKRILTYGVPEATAVTIARAEYKQNPDNITDIFPVFDYFKSKSVDLTEIASNSSVLTKSLDEIDHSFLGLQEAGLVFNVSSVNNYRYLCECYVSFLRSRALIGAHCDVFASLCDHAHISDTLVIGHIAREASIRSSVQRLKSLTFPLDSQRARLSHLRYSVARSLIATRLDCCVTSVDACSAVHGYLGVCSLRLLARTFERLFQCGFSCAEIHANLRLLNCHPRIFDSPEVSAAVTSLPPPSFVCPPSPLFSIVDKPRVEHVFRLIDKHRLKYRNMYWNHHSDIIRVCQQYNFTERQIIEAPMIFSLSSDVINYRLYHLSKHFHIWSLRYSHQFLRILLHFERSILRSKYLKYSHTRPSCVGLQSYLVDNRVFQRYARAGFSHSGTATDTVRHIAERLRLPRRRVRLMLDWHENWRVVPLSLIIANIDWLLAASSEGGAGYCLRRLLNGFLVVLYPREAVARALERLDAAQAGSDFCLQHALYLIERDHHYSGSLLFYMEAKLRPHKRGRLPNQGTSHSLLSSMT